VTIILQALSLVEKGRAYPSSLYITLEGPMEYVNARWMSNLHGFLHQQVQWVSQPFLDENKGRVLMFGVEERYA
jgi:hypothetical protein